MTKTTLPRGLTGIIDSSIVATEPLDLRHLAILSTIDWELCYFI